MIGLIFGGLLKRLSGAFSALLGFVTRNPWPCAVLALCALLGWQIYGKQAALHNLATCQAGRKADRQAYIDAEAEAAAKAIAALQAQEARYTAHAKDADNAHSTELVAANVAAAEYIRTHRVPAVFVCRSSGAAPAAAQGGDSGVSETPAADAVLVSASDINACTADYTYAVSAHLWSKGLAGE